MKNLIIILSAIFIISCSGGSEDYVVIIHTEYGDMKAILYDETPKHKENFIKLAKEGAYDNTIFHRVIKGFMIQGGDVNAKSDTEDKIEYTIDAEIQDSVTGKFLHTKGALAAARQGDDVNPKRKSSGCQFYIVDGLQFTKEQLTVDQAKLNKGVTELLKDSTYKFLYDSLVGLQLAQEYDLMNKCILSYKDEIEAVTGESAEIEINAERLKAYTEGEGAPHLDDEYTVFGRVVEGFEVIDKIASLETIPGDRPVDDIPMSIELEPITSAEIKSKYGL